MSTGEMDIFNGDLRDLTFDHAAGAEVISRLREVDGKALDVVTNGEGMYVRRSFTGDSLEAITHQGLYSFLDVWRNYYRMLNGAEVTMVESSYVVDSPEDNPIIVSRFLEFAGIGNTARSLSGEEKKRLMGKLGMLLTSSKVILPDNQGFLEDAFAVDPESGKPILVDIDPYVKYRNSSRFRTVNRITIDSAIISFMQQMHTKMEQWASSDEELIEMAHAFVLTSGGVLDDDSSFDVVNAFGELHYLSQGFHRLRGDMGQKSEEE